MTTEDSNRFGDLIEGGRHLLDISAAASLPDLKNHLQEWETRVSTILSEWRPQSGLTAKWMSLDEVDFRNNDNMHELRHNYRRAVRVRLGWLADLLDKSQAEQHPPAAVVPVGIAQAAL